MNYTKSLSRIAMSIVLVLAVAVLGWFAPLVPVSEVSAQGGYTEGGGGGFVRPPTGVSLVYESNNSDGEFTEDVNVKSGDNKVELTIEEGTIGLTEQGRRLVSIEIQEMDDPPDPPEESEIIGLTYDFGPDGATFDPPITLTFHYDPDELPEGASEGNLVLAVWDEDSGTWLKLETTVDPETNTLTAKISHFTPFTIIASTRPAAFEATYLTVFPVEADSGERVEIRARIANTGDLSGSYDVTLKINGAKEATRKVTIAGGASISVSFVISEDTAGTHTVSVNGLTETFRVLETPPPPTPAPTPPAAPAVPAPAPPVAPPAPAPSAAAPYTWAIIGGIALGVVIIVLLVYFLWWRRRIA